MSQLEDAGFLDQANTTECLFDYVLDALQIPSSSEGNASPEYSKKQLRVHEELVHISVEVNQAT